ncbi:MULTISPECIES: CHAP domain-containing protein [unclassified Bradyrhizobium]|uniref:CHAP domain-containing protein n=1 Tax=unclassified Bradyrhizobium TaxID=2631580 RepID=UPI0029160B18|nr:MULTISPECIES: CHAP domain-containing protein [unclassified Bradyrhizobium]
MITRRAALAALGASLLPTSAAFPDDRLEYRDYSFSDYYAVKGAFPSLQKDIDAADQIVRRLPTDNYFSIMQSLSEITEVGSTGELFNMRWKQVANPLIVRFFHDIGYAKTPYPGDCTSWCAATLSWCLKHAGLKIPKDPASSQSYLSYGRRITDPAPGDICVFTDVGDKAHGHVGLLVSRSGAVLRILGGNQTGDSATNCGPGYLKSKIDVTEIPINPQKKRSVGIHYLSAYVRPA